MVVVVVSTEWVDVVVITVAKVVALEVIKSGGVGCNSSGNGWWRRGRSSDEGSGDGDDRVGRGDGSCRGSGGGGNIVGRGGGCWGSKGGGGVGGSDDKRGSVCGSSGKGGDGGWKKLFEEWSLKKKNKTSFLRLKDLEDFSCKEK